MTPTYLFRFLLIAFQLLGTLVATNVYGQDKQSAAHIGFIYPLSSNGIQAGEYTNRLSLHALAGLSYSEIGFVLSGFANIIRDDAQGIQIAGFANIIQNNAAGVHVAGFTNIVKNSDTGVSVSGFLNKASTFEGTQVAGFANIVRHDTKGVQVAGFINTAENAESQVAGFANIVAHDTKGVQVAGFINTSENAENQVAGFINIAKKVKGVQVSGFINIADSSDYPIGLFNFIKDGEKSISITTDETLTGMVSFRSGGRFLYSIVGVGYNFRSDNKSLYGFEAGFGAHIPVRNSLRINTEVTTLTLSDFKDGEYFRTSLRILPAFRFGKHVELFAGPTINYVNYSKQKGKGLIDHYVWSERRRSDFQGVYIGVTGGIQYVF